MRLHRPAFAARLDSHLPPKSPSRERFEALLRSCECALHDLPIPTPFDIEELARAIGTRRGRPILLRPMRHVPRLAGLCFPSGQRDVIVYTSGTTPLHQEHIILHELCHLWFGHEPVAVLEDEIVDLLGPDLHEASVHLVFRRANYTTYEEREVEVLASLILKQAANAAESSSRDADTDELRRLDGIMASDGEDGARSR
jgi:hypothetical protein